MRFSLDLDLDSESRYSFVINDSVGGVCVLISNVRTFAIEKSKWLKCHTNKRAHSWPTLIFCVRLVSLHQLLFLLFSRCFVPFLFVLLINYLQMLF